jgi:hypothetical protein
LGELTTQQQQTQFNATHLIEEFLDKESKAKHNDRREEQRTANMPASLNDTLP